MVVLGSTWNRRAGSCKNVDDAFPLPDIIEQLEHTKDDLILPQVIACFHHRISNIPCAHPCHFVRLSLRCLNLDRVTLDNRWVYSYRLHLETAPRKALPSK